MINNIKQQTKIVLTKFIFIFIFFLLFFIYFSEANAVINCPSIPEHSISGILNSPFSDTAATSPSDDRKECILNSIKTSLKKEVLGKLSSSTINWINSGFDGRPVYMTDPYKVFKSVKEKVVEDVIYNNKNLESLHPDFELPIKFALNQYFFSKEKGDLGYKPKSTEVFDPNKKFSWKTFAETTKPDNTITNVYHKLVTDIDQTINQRQEVLQKELDQGGGYFSIRSCDDGWEYDGSPEASRHCRIVTPGATISDQVGKVMGSNFDRVLLANEVDGLMGSFVNNVIERGSSGRGLASFSDPDYSFVEASGNVFKTERNRLLEQYNDSAYDVAIKALKSMQRSLKNIKSIIQNDLVCWQDKQTQTKSGTTFYKFAGINPLDKQYEFLNNITIDNNINFVLNSKEISNIDSKTEKLNREINSLLAQKQSLGLIRQSIADAKDYASLYNVIKYTTSTGVDLNSFAERINTLKKEYKVILDGEISSYQNYQPIRKGGISTSYQYCRDFSIIEKPNDASIIKSSIEQVSELKNKLATNFMDSYNIQEDLLNVQNSDNTDFNIQDNKSSSVTYDNLISAAHISKVGSNVITNWKDFFTKEKILKFTEKTSYLANLIGRKSFGYTDYLINSFSVPQEVSYDGIILDNLVDHIGGNGQYCTKKGWSKYKVYIPPFAKKMALLFKPERGTLHRVHLTFNSPEINHNNVKALSYNDIPKDNNHYGLGDLFVNQKTVLLNIKYNGLMLEERSSGVSVAGLVLGEEKIKKYIGKNGGWLYIDIAQDNKAAGVVKYSPTDKVKILYYIDIDRESQAYKNWAKNADQNLKELQGIEVFERNCQ